MKVDLSLYWMNPWHLVTGTSDHLSTSSTEIERCFMHDGDPNTREHSAYALLPSLHKGKKASTPHRHRRLPCPPAICHRGSTMRSPSLGRTSRRGLNLTTWAKGPANNTARPAIKARRSNVCRVLNDGVPSVDQQCLLTQSPTCVQLVGIRT